MRYVLAFVVPLIVIGLAAPMVLGMVPPNRFYGFRTPRTLASPDVWYPANRASGLFMIAAALASLIFNSILITVFPDWTLASHVQWMAGATVIPLLLSLVASLAYVRNL